LFPAADPGPGPDFAADVEQLLWDEARWPLELHLAAQKMEAA